MKEGYEIIDAKKFHSKGRSIKEEPDMIRLTLEMDRVTWRRFRVFNGKFPAPPTPSTKGSEE